jgi:Rrf2 family transcriptional regulator, iron-sulfur cluster assembly transcription factor
MKLFKSSEYAIRCLVFMAVSECELCSVKRLSAELNIPFKYLGQLMGHLREAGFVESVRGKNGGYRIARPLEEIRLEQIVDSVEGLKSYDRCILGFEQCDENNPCPLHEFWSGPKESIQQMLAHVTLAQMVKSKGKKIS